jgi:predicted anti-sigma-YlaC factor YlaD
MNQAEQYLSQALAAEAAADASALENVKERHLRSASAWREMADRADRTSRLRTERANEAASRLL